MKKIRLEIKKEEKNTNDIYINKKITKDKEIKTI